MSPEQATLDQKKVEEFSGRRSRTSPPRSTTGLVLIGDKLGLYRAMAGAGPLTPAELAKRTGTRERYVREWLSAQAAGGYVTYDPATGGFTLPAEQAFLLLDADLPGAFQLSVGSVRDEPRITDAFRTGAGVGWHETTRECTRDASVLRPGYAMNLVSQWIPALDGVKARLETGGRVADVGCGHAASTIIMAQAFPRATITGLRLPSRLPSRSARRAADKAGGGDRCPSRWRRPRPTREPPMTSSRFSTACTTWGTRSGRRATCASRSPAEGVWMLVEPFANDRLEDNLNPVGRLYYSASTLLCTPASLSQEVGPRARRPGW